MMTGRPLSAYKSSKTIYDLHLHAWHDPARVHHVLTGSHNCLEAGARRQRGGGCGRPHCTPARVLAFERADPLPMLVIRDWGKPLTRPRGAQTIMHRMKSRKLC